MNPLTEREPRPLFPLTIENVIDFERNNPTPGDAKNSRIRETFGISSYRYFQHLNGLLDDPNSRAAAIDPITTNAARRRRESAASHRAERTFARRAH